MISFSQHCHKVPFPFTVKPPIRETGLYWQTAAHLVRPLRAASHYDCCFSDLTRLISLSASSVVYRSQVIKRTFGIKGLKSPCQNNQKQTDREQQCFSFRNDVSWQLLMDSEKTAATSQTINEKMTSFLKNCWIAWCTWQNLIFELWVF